MSATRAETSTRAIADQQPYGAGREAFVHEKITYRLSGAATDGLVGDQAPVPKAIGKTANSPLSISVGAIDELDEFSASTDLVMPLLRTDPVWCSSPCGRQLAPHKILPNGASEWLDAGFSTWRRRRSMHTLKVAFLDRPHDVALGCAPRRDRVACRCCRRSGDES
jgi:hypothetical protein